MSHPIPLHSLRLAEMPTRSAPRPSFMTVAGRFDLETIMVFAHIEARADVACATAWSVVRRYAAARAAYFRRQQDDSRSLLAGMLAERERGFAIEGWKVVVGILLMSMGGHQGCRLPREAGAGDSVTAAIRDRK